MNRRRVLAALGAGTAALAGCSAISGRNSGDGGSDEPAETNGTDTTTDESDADNENQDERRQVPPPAIQQGELISDFENLDEWTAFQGQLSADEDAALTGIQAARIDHQGTLAGISREFPKGLDASNRNLSLALRVDTPRPARVTVQLCAPTEANSIESIRRVLGPYSGWLRMDVGYSNKRGSPDLQNVRKINVFLKPYDGEDSEIRFFLEDLRATSCAKQGYVVLTFDDGVATQYTNGFPLFRERNMPATVAVNSNTVGDPERLSIDQLRKLHDAGWDVSSHPEEGFYRMNIDRLRENVKSNKEFLIEHGFSDGARHLSVPYHHTNHEIVSITREHHTTSGYFGGTTSALPFTDPMHLSRASMTDFEGFSELVDFAAEYNQLAIGYAHGVGSGEYDDITEEELTRVLDYVEQRDVKVVTPSYLIDNQDGL